MHDNKKNYGAYIWQKNDTNELDDHHLLSSCLTFVTKVYKSFLHISQIYIVWAVIWL